MKWKVFQVDIVRDFSTKAGMKEKLTPFQINETIPSYNQRLLDVPRRTIPMGFYKLLFRFEVGFCHDANGIVASILVCRLTLAYRKYLCLKKGSLTSTSQRHH